MLINATKKVTKMHARRNPNGLSVSSAAYSQLSPSVTSATFLSPTVASRRGLLSPSPPPSPSLPSLIPRHGKPPPTKRHARLVKRILIGAVGVTVLLWLIIRQIYAFHGPRQSHSVEDVGGEYEMVGGNTLPQEPSALIVEDIKGDTKWTVSIPSSYDFPLRPQQYREICKQSMQLSQEVRTQVKASSSITKRMLGYYQKDQYYLDVQEAEEQGLLPQSKPQDRPKSFVDDEDFAKNKNAPNGMKVCDRSLTYVMETKDAGLGNSMMRVWMSYGLAMKENRTFFMDEKKWPYGKWSTYFLPLPPAGCLPPPRSQMVPCPHNARHIVVSGATVSHVFGHSFVDEYEDPRKVGVLRQRPIFSLARAGYEALFKLRADDAKYLSERMDSMLKPTTSEPAINIGIHVRRGDKHPYEFQYREDYIPLERYMDTARDIFTERVENVSSGNLNKRHNTASRLILASDDPTVYEDPSLSGPNTLRAQDRIILATKQTLEAAAGKKNPWIDEITGWEGGFYRDVFFSLGRNDRNANDMLENNGVNNEDDVVPEGAMKLRELVGRAYLLDLSMVAKSDVVVCTVSSIGCRILAVMLGWEKAIGKDPRKGPGDWRNVDGDFDWRGIVW